MCWCNCLYTGPLFPRSEKVTRLRVGEMFQFWQEAKVIPLPSQLQARTTHHSPTQLSYFAKYGRPTCHLSQRRDVLQPLLQAGGGARAPGLGPLLLSRRQATTQIVHCISTSVNSLTTEDKWWVARPCLAVVVPPAVEQGEVCGAAQPHLLALEAAQPRLEGVPGAGGRAVQAGLAAAGRLARRLQTILWKDEKHIGIQ